MDIEFSKRLGKLTSHQFQKALSKFDLGNYISAEPVLTGLFGQNVILSSTKGKFVLRGKPHYPWQFPKEKLGSELLHRYTKVPVPFPYLYEPDNDIFGWDFILMPYMPGINPISDNLSMKEKIDIAFVLGQNLSELHQCKCNFFGKYDLEINSIKSMDLCFNEWFKNDVEIWVRKSCDDNSLNENEINWIKEYLNENLTYLSNDFQPCFVMNDYNPGNMLINNCNNEWIVSGLFDLMEYYFGDGDADLVRLIAIYSDKYKSDSTNLIKGFINGYFSKTVIEANIIEKFKLFTLRDRLIFWEYGSRQNIGWITKGSSFIEYVKNYMNNKDVIAVLNFNLQK